MQISRSQPNVQPTRPVQAVAVSPESTRARSTPAPAQAERPTEPPAEPAGQSARERLGNLAAAYGERLEGLVEAGKLTSSQAAALQETQQSFLKNLHRLAAQHLEGGEPSGAIGAGLAKVMQDLRSSFREALAQPTDVQGGATPAERLANVRETLGARLEALLSHAGLGNEARASVKELAGEFDALFQRLGEALAQGNLKNPEHLSAAFADLLGSLRESVRTVLAEDRPTKGAPYTPHGALKAGELDPGSIERLA